MRLLLSFLMIAAMVSGIVAIIGILYWLHVTIITMLRTQSKRGIGELQMVQIVIELSERDYQLACKYPDALIAVYAHAIKNGTPLNITDDGTLEITVDDYTKVNRVLVQDKNNCGGLFYADSN